MKFLNHIPAHEKKITLSTLLTFARIVLTPFIVVAMVYAYWGIACTLFVVAAITDALDGYLARLRNECTFFGAALDPIADKILLLSCFCTLACVKPLLVPCWFVAFVLVKEIIVLGGAAWIYGARGTLTIAPTFLGKLTTVLQICFIIWLCAWHLFGWTFNTTYYLMLGVLLCALGACVVQYIQIGWRQYKKNSYKI